MLYPGKNLAAGTDSFNFYLSQLPVKVAQAFSIFHTDMRKDLEAADDTVQWALWPHFDNIPDALFPSRLAGPADTAQRKNSASKENYPPFDDDNVPLEGSVLYLVPDRRDIDHRYP